MDVALSIADRLILLDILPPKGDLTDMMVVEGLRPQIILSDEEMARASVKQEGTQVSWDRTRDFEKTVTFGPNGLRIVQETLKGKMEAKEVVLEYLPLYRKFGLASMESPT